MAAMAPLPPDERRPRASRVDRNECLFCGGRYRSHSRSGVYSTCPHCGEKNPGPAMRDALAARAARTRPRRRRPSARASRSAPATNVGPSQGLPAAPGGKAPTAPVRHKATIGPLHVVPPEPPPPPAPKTTAKPPQAPQEPPKAEDEGGSARLARPRAVWLASTRRPSPSSTRSHSATVCRRISPSRPYVESGLNPAAIGDQGNSVGLYQLNSQGEGAGLSIAQRQDPTQNATIALASRARSSVNLTADPGAIAAAAQRPANPAAYAAAVDAALPLFSGSSSATSSVAATTVSDPITSAAGAVFTGLGHGIINGIVALLNKVWGLVETNVIALAVAATVLYVWTNRGTAL